MSPICCSHALLFGKRRLRCAWHSAQVSRVLSRQFLTESVLLALFGAGLGLLLAFAGLRALKTFIPASISQVETIKIDARVLIFTALVAVVTGIAFGLAPAIQGSHLNLNDTLKEGGRDSAGGSKGNRVRSLLVIGEVAVSFVLLIGAGLLINSFFHLRNLDPGISCRSPPDDESRISRR